MFSLSAQRLAKMIEKIEEEEAINEDLSIHPRHWTPPQRKRHGYRGTDKSNTRKVPSVSANNRKIKAIEQHLSNHPDDLQSQGHLNKLKARIENV